MDPSTRPIQFAAQNHPLGQASRQSDHHTIDKFKLAGYPEGHDEISRRPPRSGGHNSAPGISNTTLQNQPLENADKKT
jgi:hypothetical protein